MKRHLGIFLMITAVFLAAVSCEEKQEKVRLDDLVSVELTDKGQTSVTFVVNSQTVSEIAYLLVESDNKPSAVSAPIVFHEGETAATGERILLSFLHPMTEYCLYVAARSGGEYLDGVLTTEFVTTDTSDEFSLLNVDYDGFTLSMRLPDDTKARGNVIRYKFNSLYNYNHFVKFGEYKDPYLLEWNTGLKFGDDEDRMTLEISKETEYLRDADGELILDELTQQAIQIHQPIAPGEPIVFLAGEYEKANQTDHEDDWRKPLFDNGEYEASGSMDTDPYWTGFFKRMFITSKAPGQLDGEVTIEELSVGAVDARIKLTPSENVEKYCVWIVEDEEYRSVHLPRLNNNEDFVQWFVTSYDATYFAGTMIFEEPVELSLKVHAYDAATPETDYHVFVTAGNSDFSLQSFSSHTLHTTEKNEPAPEVVVTALEKAPEGEEDSPFDVWFNIRCTSGNAVRGSYAANYIGPWIQEYNEVKSNEELILMGHPWSDEEIIQINSAEGYNISIGTLENMTTRLGVILYNSEDTANDVDAVGSKAIADAKAGVLPPAQRVESDLFGSLVGDWILSGKVVHYNWGSSRWYTTKEDMETKVRISAGVEYPEVLPESVYETYREKEDVFGFTRDDVTRQYENFKSEAAAWNARLRGQNRLLCFGFNEGYNVQDMSRDLNAFDAFCDFDYVSYDNVAILHDFGPKWYLQIDEGDIIRVPFNSARFAPMGAHYYYTMYMAAIASDDSGYTAGADSEGNMTETLYFPVTKLDDDTFVIQPLVMTPDDSAQEVTYYPNVVTLDMNISQPVFNPKYVSALTLKRDTGTKSGSLSASASGTGKTVRIGGPSSRKARTTFSGMPVYRKEVYILK